MDITDRADAVDSRIGVDARHHRRCRIGRRIPVLWRRIPINIIHRGSVRRWTDRINFRECDAGQTPGNSHPIDQSRRTVSSALFHFDNGIGQ